MNPFEISKDSPIRVEEFMGSNIYYIDDFYKHPDLVLKYFDKHPTSMHKPIRQVSSPSFNGIHFYDERHIVDGIKLIKPVYDYLSNICKQGVPLHGNKKIITNKIKLCRTGFNTYRDSYWFPHTDYGYNGLVYLNKDDEIQGTNLYEPNTGAVKIRDEHYNTWSPKHEWTVIKKIRPKFNRCVLFDGKKFWHGMNITNERYFDEYRLNQAFFFKQ